VTDALFVDSVGSGLLVSNPLVIRFIKKNDDKASCFHLGEKMKRFIPVGFILILLVFAFPVVAATGGGLSKLEQLRRSVELVPGNLNLRYYLGCALLEQGFFPEAIVELRKAYPAYVDSKEMNYTLAIAYYQVGDLDSSLLYLGQAEDLGALQEPETYSVVNLHYKIGLKHLERSSFQEAERAFLRVVQLGAGRLQVHRSLGDLYSRMGDSGRSLTEFERYSQDFPEDGEVQKFLYTRYLNRGLEFLNAGDLTQAGVFFEKAMAMTKENSLAVYFTGYLAYQKGQYALAAQTLLSILPALPDDAYKSSTSLLFNCAIELSKNEETLQQALEIVTLLIAGGNNSVEEHSLAGTMQMKLGQYEKALAHFEKVLSLDPANEGALLNLLSAQGKAVEQLTAQGWDSLKADKLIEAQQAADAALKIDPSHKRAGLLKGQVLYTRDQYANNFLAEAEKLLMQGTYDEALQQVRKALAMSPGSEAGTLLQEKILTALGQEIAGRISQGQAALAAQEFGKATTAFEAVLGLDPSNAQAFDGMNKIKTIFKDLAKKKSAEGRDALGKGEPTVAVDAFEGALQLEPDMEEAKEGLVAAQALIEKMVTQRIQAAKEAFNAGSYGEALRQFQLALDLRESPLLRQEIDTTKQALATRVSELMASADQASSKDDYKHATNLYRKVLEIDPGNTDAKTKLANLSRTSDSALSGYLRQAREAMRDKKIPRALAAYKKVLDLDSANAEAMQGLRDWEAQSGPYLENLEGKAAESLVKGDYAQSERLYKEVLALSPGRAKAQEGIKKITQLRGAALNPADGERLYLEGIALYTQGRYGEAVAVWKKVQLLDPGHVKAGLNIEKALRKLQSIKERRDG